MTLLNSLLILFVLSMSSCSNNDARGVLEVLNDTNVYESKPMTENYSNIPDELDSTICWGDPNNGLRLCTNFKNNTINIYIFKIVQMTL